MDGQANVRPVQSTHPPPPSIPHTVVVAVVVVHLLVLQVPDERVTGQAINHTLVVYNDPSSVQLTGHSTTDVAVFIFQYLFPSIAGRG